MTRMEKWEGYRNEINQASRIGFSITQANQKIEKYKKEIDSINPAILQNMVPADLNLHKGVSEVAVSEQQIPAQITKMFKDLNKAKAVTNKNTISTILFNLKNDNILDDNKKLKEGWLEGNNEYASLAAFIKDANLNINKNKEFEKDLQTKFESLSANKPDASIKTIEQLSKNGQKNIGHHVFVISIAIASIFFVITFVLLMIRWFI